MVNIRAVRAGVAGFFVLYLLAVIWPGALLFRKAEPFIAGVPYALFWPALWIILGGVALAILDRAESRAEREEAIGSEDHRPPTRPTMENP
jgi:hypothetical protein